MSMVRAYLKYVNIDLARSDEELVDFRIISRVYDRQSGNFKAMGWHIRLTYASAYSGRSLPFVMFDRELQRSMLT
jgi:hypothetical protein